jgi:regulator of replication initiation timing
MKEKCCKCKEWKERSAFIPLSSGSKPKCIACVEKLGKINELEKKISATSALLFQLKEQLSALGVNHPKLPSEEKVLEEKVKRLTKIEKNKEIAKNALRVHPRFNLAMKKGNNVVYYYQNGSFKPAKIWEGQWGPYTSYKTQSGQYKYIGVDKLKEQIFRNDSKLGV